MLSLLREDGKKFFNSFWNVVDFASAALSICAISMYAVRKIHVDLTLEKLTNDVEKGR